MEEVATRSTVTCPSCGARAEVEMPLDACQFFWPCPSCGTMLRPKAGDCCVFCSYGDVPCPPVQRASAGATNGGGCCGQARDEAADRAHWEDIHRTRPLDEVSWFQARPEASLRLIAATGVGPEARILDVGGGASRLVDHLLEAGYRHPGVLDVSEAALAASRRRLGARAERVEWFACDVTRFRPPHAWDVWHDRALLHFFTEEADRRRYREVLCDSVAPGGHAVLATFGPEGPMRCSGLPVRRYDARQLHEVVGPTFHLEEHFRVDHTTPSGGRQQFQYARFRRKPDR